MKISNSNKYNINLHIFDTNKIPVPTINTDIVHEYIALFNYSVITSVTREKFSQIWYYASPLTFTCPINSFVYIRGTFALPMVTFSFL